MTNPRKIEMTDAVDRPRRANAVLHAVAEHPASVVLRLLPIGIAVLLMVDLALGSTAEYFNAAQLARAWATVISGGSVSTMPAFIADQASLGATLAMSIGTILLFLEPAVVLALVVVPMSLIARRYESKPDTNLDHRSDKGAIVQQHIHTEITIDATPEEVWAALVDLDDYPNWNPYHVSVRRSGDLEIGCRLVVDIRKPNGEQVTIKPRVLSMEPLRDLSWGGGVAGVFRGEHRFVLEPTRDGTKLIHSEDFTGFAVRYAGLDAIEEGYELMNKALKAYVEAGRNVSATGYSSALEMTRGVVSTTDV